MSVNSKHELVARLEKEGNPLTEGNKVTFVWVGEKRPELRADFNDWGGKEPKTEMSEVAPGVWTFSKEFEPDAYIEYRFAMDGAGVKDPYNRREITNGMGKMNSYFAMPENKHTNLVRPQAGVKQGEVTTLTIPESFMMTGRNRALYLYRPPVDEPVPLLVVLDGKDYYQRAKLTTIVDNLIAQKRIRPIAMAMIQHGGRARFLEYMCSEATLGFLLNAVGQRAKAELNLLDIEKNPGANGILGASMGGLMSLYSGLRVPEVFGRVISQSGAFSFDPRYKEAVINQLVRYYDPQPLKIWMDVGRYEWLYEPNQKMHELLVSKGYDVTYREYNGGHNYTSWRDEVIDGLETVFPPL